MAAVNSEGIAHLAEVDGCGAVSLDDALEGIFDCHRCALGDGRTHVVPGDGNPRAKVMFIGEAPGKNEDLQGVPFVGSAGNLLNELLEEIGLRREGIYIANILKCRPPRNRDPKADEIASCTPWLRAQIAAVDPKVLVTLGNFASRFVLQTKDGITTLRGRVHVMGSFKVIPTFHPAATIYDRSKMDTLRDDFGLIASVLAQEE